MTLTFVSRLTLICTLIFAVLLADVSVATPTKTEDKSHTHKEYSPLIGASNPRCNERCFPWILANAFRRLGCRDS